MAKHPPHIIELAKRGAEIQLRDLMQEIRYLIELFPHLRDSFDEDELPLRFIMARDADRASREGAKSPRRGRRTMSAAARKAVSRRMKKYWSTRRKATKG